MPGGSGPTRRPAAAAAAGWILILSNGRHVFPFLGHGNLLRNCREQLRQNSLESRRSMGGRSCPGSEWHWCSTNGSAEARGFPYRRLADGRDVVGALAPAAWQGGGGSFYADGSTVARSLGS